MSGGLIFFAILAFIVLVAILKTAVIVPQKTAYIVERLGKYRCTLDAGFHILIPFFDRIAYRHTLKACTRQARQVVMPSESWRCSRIKRWPIPLTPSLA